MLSQEDNAIQVYKMSANVYYNDTLKKSKVVQNALFKIKIMKTRKALVQFKN